VIPGRTGIVDRFLSILLVLVGRVPLRACVNVAGMLLARGAARGRAIALRSPSARGGWRVMRQLLTETVLLSHV